MDQLVVLGFVRPDGGRLHPTARVTSWQGLLIAHDPDSPRELGPETVLGINNTTRTLAQLTPRVQVDRTLDVATGSGGLALLASRHARVVVATDVSQRAVRLARLSAAMNGITLDCRAGDLFEPVAEDPPFDLILANLPFVVSPDAAFRFRDGGQGGDAVSRDALTSAAGRLTDGGMAVMLCNWVVPEGATWDEPLREWVGSLACDCVAVHHSTDAPEAYARRWNEFLLVQDPAAYAAAIERWEDFYRRSGTVGIAGGAVLLRHRTGEGPSWFQALSMDVVPQGDGGSQLSRVVRNLDELSGADDDALLSRTVALVRNHRLEQAMAYDGSWSMEPGRMVLQDTAGPVGVVDPLAIHAVLRLDGVMPLSAICDSVITDTGLAATEMLRATVATCRRLLEAGCLDFADF